MTKRYIHTARVVGEGVFPIDMLRYDACHPASEKDSGIIQSHRLRGVNVRKTTDTRFSPWTPARWKSFGWEMVDEMTEAR